MVRVLSQSYHRQGEMPTLGLGSGSGSVSILTHLHGRKAGAILLGPGGRGGVRDGHFVYDLHCVCLCVCVCVCVWCITLNLTVNPNH